MKTSSKAFLLSALVFPGLGHFLLKRYVRAILLIAISTVCFYFLLVASVTIAQGISDSILKGDIPIDIAIISAEILKQTRDMHLNQLSTVTSVLLFCWIVGMIDSYRVGREQDRSLSSGNTEA